VTNQTAILVEGLSKEYRIGGRQERYGSIRDTLVDIFAGPFRKGKKLLQGEYTGAAGLDTSFWALKDVSFEVRQGEVIGVIGANGAGKSTLLKILTRITEPTGGYAKIMGRVGSLLEVGTGFHPELTGRENVYLCGAILGMKKAQIEKNFDEIVAFAEVDNFIDTPVKHYSTGMQVRLAFAVAAHLEPEVLLVDEVLAVGDMRFQRKCMNKMEDVGHEGRTILFVSHNMQAVARLCQRAIVLNQGRLVMDSPSQEAVNYYLSADIGCSTEREWSDPKTAPGGEIGRLRKVRVCQGEETVKTSIDIRRDITLEFTYEVLAPGYMIAPNFTLWNEEGVCLFHAQDVDPLWIGRPRNEGTYISRVTIPGNFLAEGTMYVNVAMTTFEPLIVQCHERNVVAFHVHDPIEGDSARGQYTGMMLGVVRPLLKWETIVSASTQKSQVCLTSRENQG
jgi:lipopolysaccharide transport system ATP-binding protein